MTEKPNDSTAAGSSEQDSRRDFLRCAGEKLSGLMLLAGFGGAMARSLCPQEERGQDGQAGGGYDPQKHEYAYLVDISKCIGCGSCVRACERENDVPEGYFRTWIERYQISHLGEQVHVDSPNGGHDGFDPLVTGNDVTKAFFVPKLCNHCAETPCVQLCPVGASYLSPDGLILVDEQRCIGCGYCVQACPYGSRFIHEEKGVASKCTFCYHRVTKGLKPACVHVCPTGARQFGDLKDKDDKVAHTIATEPVRVLKPELRTKPKCYYLNLTMEVH